MTMTSQEVWIQQLRRIAVRHGASRQAVDMLVAKARLLPLEALRGYVRDVRREPRSYLVEMDELGGGRWMTLRQRWLRKLEEVTLDKTRGNRQITARLMDQAGQLSTRELAKLTRKNAKDRLGVWFPFNAHEEQTDAVD